jgi:nucleoside-diphosphate kinase
MSIEQTLAIIKPDALQKGVIGQIIDRMENSDLQPVAIKMMQLTKARAEGFYAVHRGKPFFDELTTFMSSGPVLVLTLQGKNAIAKWRETMGATNPEEAADGTIRKDFAIDISQNAVHGSDAPDTAKTEIGYFFESHEIVSYDWL